MAWYRMEFLVREVLKRLDANLEGTPEFTGGATSVARIVEEAFPSVAARVMSGMPADKLDESLELECDVHPDGDGTGHIVLPENFLRLRSFRMSDWDYAVENAVAAGSAASLLQLSPHAGLRGNPRRPAVVISRAGPFPTLTYYSTEEADHKVAEARYIPRPEPDRHNRIWLPRGALYDIIENFRNYMA